MPVQLSAKQKYDLPLRPSELREFADALPDDAEVNVEVHTDGDQRDPYPVAVTLSASWVAAPPAAKQPFPHHKPGYRGTFDGLPDLGLKNPEGFIGAECPDEHLPGTKCGTCGEQIPRLGFSVPPVRLDPTVWPEGSDERAHAEQEIAEGRAQRYVDQGAVAASFRRRGRRPGDMTHLDS